MPSGSVRDRSSGGVLDFSGGMEAGNRYIKQNFVLTRRENHHILISVIILVILAEKIKAIQEWPWIKGHMMPILRY
jgi:hypothetical protein